MHCGCTGSSRLAQGTYGTSHTLDYTNWMVFLQRRKVWCILFPSHSCLRKGTGEVGSETQPLPFVSSNVALGCMTLDPAELTSLSHRTSIWEVGIKIPLTSGYLRISWDHIWKVSQCLARDTCPGDVITWGDNRGHGDGFKGFPGGAGLGVDLNLCSLSSRPFDLITWPFMLKFPHQKTEYNTCYFGLLWRWTVCQLLLHDKCYVDVCICDQEIWLL